MIRYTEEEDEDAMEQDNMPTVEQPVAYEPPQIERVLTSDDLAREVHYAGQNLSLDLAQG